MASQIYIYNFGGREIMDRTTIMLPPELKIRASNQAKKERISLGQFIREALKKSLDSENG